jgi:hypothetical protein
LERVAVVSGTTAKAIGKGEKNTNKSSVLSRDNQFRAVNRPNHILWSKAIESIIVQAETIPVLGAGIFIDHRGSFDVIIFGGRVFENHTFGNIFKRDELIIILNSNFHFVHPL